MIKVEGEWQGESHQEFIEKEMARLTKKAESAVLKAALFFEGRVKETLTGNRSGRVYKIGKRGRTYQASAPGEPPASPTGDLRKSITHTLPEWNGDIVSSEVGTAMAQSRLLEYGGITGRDHATRILPRPYFAPAWLSAEEPIGEILGEAVKT